MPASASACRSRAAVRSRSRLWVAAEALRQRLQARVLHGQFAELLRAAGHLVCGQQSAHLLEAVGQFLQALADGFLHGCGFRARHSPGCLQFVTSAQCAPLAEAL